MGLRYDRTEVMQKKNSEGYQTKPRRNLEKFGEPEKISIMVISRLEIVTEKCFVVNDKYTAVTNGFKLCSLISVHTHMRVRNL